MQIGPFELPPRLNGQNYLHFLQNDLDDLINRADLPPQIRNQLILIQDGAPPHYAVEVRDYLNARFPDRWIGRASPGINWPARSPDLNVNDFFLWGHVKNIVYRGDTSNRAETLQRIHQAFADIPPQTIRRATQSFTRRLEMCIANDGRHFEHLLH